MNFKRYSEYLFSNFESLFFLSNSSGVIKFFNHLKSFILLIINSPFNFSCSITS